MLPEKASSADETMEKYFLSFRRPTKPRKSLFCPFVDRRSLGKMIFAPSSTDEATEK